FSRGRLLIVRVPVCRSYSETWLVNDLTRCLPSIVERELPLAAALDHPTPSSPLAEKKRHPVALADRVELGAAGGILTRPAVAWWQHPHAVRPVRRIVRIGVDLALAHQFEPVGA